LFFLFENSLFVNTNKKINISGIKISPNKTDPVFAGAKLLERIISFIWN